MREPSPHDHEDSREQRTGTTTRTARAENGDAALGRAWSRRRRRSPLGCTRTRAFESSWPPAQGHGDGAPRHLPERRGSTRPHGLRWATASPAAPAAARRGRRRGVHPPGSCARQERRTSSGQGPRHACIAGRSGCMRRRTQQTHPAGAGNTNTRKDQRGSQDQRAERWLPRADGGQGGGRAEKADGGNSSRDEGVV